MPDFVFTIGDLIEDIELRVPSINDKVSKADRIARGWRKTMAAYAKRLRDEGNPFAFGSTFDGTDPSTGTAEINTGQGDVFRVALVSGARSVAHDSLYMWNGTAWALVPRIDPDDITADTVSGFWEVKGYIMIYVKDGTITTPASFHYHYNRFFSADTSNTSTEIDAIPEDYDELLDTVVSFVEE
jgi:hypothetical protein